VIGHLVLGVAEQQDGSENEMSEEGGCSTWAEQRWKQMGGKEMI
jgi:hypothetical protein